RGLDAGAFDKGDAVAHARRALAPGGVLHGADAAKGPDLAERFRAHRHIAGGGKAMALHIIAGAVTIDALIGLDGGEPVGLCRLDTNVATDDVDLGMLVEITYDPRQPVRHGDAVRVDEEE